MGIAMPTTKQKLASMTPKLVHPNCAQSNLMMNLVLEFSLALMMGPTLERVEW